MGQEKREARKRRRERGATKPRMMVNKYLENGYSSIMDNNNFLH